MRVENSGRAEHTVIPDRIEAGTFLIAGAIVGKEVTITRAEPRHLKAILIPAQSGFIQLEKTA
jgi:UDP-N-acetylglucosamine 1-carboxyvinyltransferase